MQPLKLHIVSFDVPYPADYGGAIDVYYKIKSLAEAGAELYLHCYQYGRTRAEELDKWCKKVWYYPRRTGIKGISSRLPYIVYSRRDAQLLQRLTELNAPILFEGVHSTYFLGQPALKDRYKAIRTHNIEHDYYAQLAAKEKSFLKKTYYNTEASLLKRYEHKLDAAQGFFALSAEDDIYFHDLYPAAEHAFIAPFHPYSSVISATGRGNYCLYHGNLSHQENIEAVNYLLREVFSKVNVPFIVAGRNPSAQVVAACKQLPNCELIANPATEQMEQLVKEAHIHVLPTFQATGMKLKLLYAIYSGRHVLVNKLMLHGTGLQECCAIANTANEMCNKINELMGTPFTEELISSRTSILSKQYDNKKNAAKLLTYLQH